MRILFIIVIYTCIQDDKNRLYVSISISLNKVKILRIIIYKKFSVTLKTKFISIHIMEFNVYFK